MPIKAYLIPYWEARKQQEQQLQQEEDNKREKSEEIMEEGSDIYSRWVHTITRKPPEDFLGRIFWTLGVIEQTMISMETFPAAIGCFLMEEAIQTAGMGAYMLSTAKQWEPLLDYLDTYDTIIDRAETIVKTLATISPITGGTVLFYIQAAKKNSRAFRDVANIKILEQAEQDREQREKLLEQSKYGILRITSSPSNAEIWIDGTNTELLTPETLKKIEVGHHIIELRYYDRKTEQWRIKTTEIDIEPNTRKEIKIIIPETTQEHSTTETEEQTTTTPQLPKYIKAEVIGDHAIDGDTFTTTDGETIRLLMIDAPETGRPKYEEAKNYLNTQIQDKKITLTIYTTQPKDGYNRTLAIARNYKGDINLAMLNKGLARTDIATNLTIDPTKYIEAEKIAQTRHIGIWENYP